MKMCGYGQAGLYHCPVTEEKTKNMVVFGTFQSVKTAMDGIFRRKRQSVCLESAGNLQYTIFKETCFGIQEKAVDMEKQEESYG